VKTILESFVFVMIVWFFINISFKLIEKYLDIPHKVYVYDIVSWFGMLFLFLLSVYMKKK